MKKKALSPLIATILLVVVAVVLITIVLTWGKNFTTSSLDKTNDVIDDSCRGATIAITDCDINSDNFIKFYVRNTSDSYTFPDSDDFTVDFKDSSDNFDAGNAISPTMSSLSPGETIQGDMNLTAEGITGTYVDVTVKSSMCPNDAIATYRNCHK